MSPQEQAFVRARCGALDLLVPGRDTAVTTAAHGQLWQWIGTTDLWVAMTVVVRRNTSLTTPMNIRDRLTWQLDQVEKDMDSVTERIEPQEIEAAIGADGRPSCAGSLRGVRRGMAVLERVVVTTDGTDLYWVDMIVGDSAEGSALAQEVIDSVQVSV
jgi:hypothetical protein